MVENQILMSIYIPQICYYCIVFVSFVMMSCDVQIAANIVS